MSSTTGFERPRRWSSLAFETRYPTRLTRRTNINTLARVRIDWDPPKANLRDHGVGFPEAATVLEDELALTREDPEAIGEQRFVTLGLSGLGNLLVVIYNYRDADRVRIISAWKANRRRLQYEKGRR